MDTKWNKSGFQNKASCITEKVVWKDLLEEVKVFCDGGTDGRLILDKHKMGRSTLFLFSMHKKTIK